jgi:hypothetical protein
MALSFEIADVLSDPHAAAEVRAEAERYLRRAAELEDRERNLLSARRRTGGRYT